MKKLALLILVLATLAACRTTEANYREAYEKTVAAHDAVGEGHDYGAVRRPLAAQAVISGADTIPVVMERVSAVGNSNGESHEVLAYNVVAGRFKQKFNAFSLCDRLIQAGYMDAFVVQDAEPHYYIVAGTFATAKDAQAALDRLKADAPVAMASPLPYILYDSRKQGAGK